MGLNQECERPGKDACQSALSHARRCPELGRNLTQSEWEDPSRQEYTLVMFDLHVDVATYREV